jgi:hypothetical protein
MPKGPGQFKPKVKEVRFSLLQIKNFPEKKRLSRRIHGAQAGTRVSRRYI